MKTNHGEQANDSVQVVLKHSAQRMPSRAVEHDLVLLFTCMVLGSCNFDQAPTPQRLNQARRGVASTVTAAVAKPTVSTRAMQH
jgi:hypothetical protein